MSRVEAKKKMMVESVRKIQRGSLFLIFCLIMSYVAFSIANTPHLVLIYIIFLCRQR